MQTEADAGSGRTEKGIAMSNKLGRRRREELAARAAGTFIPEAGPLPPTYYDSMAVTSPHVLDDIARTAREHARHGGREDFVNMDEVETWDRKAAWNAEIEARVMRAAEAMGRSPQSCLDMLRRDRRTLDAIAYNFEVDMLHLMRHRLSGLSTYRIAPGLSDRLIDTRMNVPTARMRLPFNSVMLVYEDQTANEALDALCRKSKDHGVITVFVSQCTVDGVRRWNMHITRIRRKTLDRVDALIVRSLALDETGTAEDAIRTEWDDRAEAGDEHAERVGAFLDGIRGGHHSDEVHYGPGMRFYRLVINTILYLTSHKPSVSTPRSAGTTRSAGSRGPVEYVVLGDGMARLDQRTREAMRSGGVGVGGRALHKVKGHYKDQVCGPGGRDRIHIFVEPYLRGDDADTLVSRPRLVA